MFNMLFITQNRKKYEKRIGVCIYIYIYIYRHTHISDQISNSVMIPKPDTKAGTY